MSTESGPENAAPKKSLKPAPDKPTLGQYVELEVYSNFSFLRGASHPAEIIEQAATLGYGAVAITDLHSLAGIVRAHQAAKKHGITLLVGSSVELYCDLPRAEDKPLEEKRPAEKRLCKENFSTLPLRLLLYPTGLLGYGQLCSLLSRGKLRAEKGQCLLDIEDLRQYNQGLIAIVRATDFSHPQLLNLLQQLKSIFHADRLSLALTNSYGPENYRQLELTEELSSLSQLPLVATSAVHYHVASRRALQDVLTCIRLGVTIENAGFNLSPNAERYLKPAEEMLRMYRRYPQALRRTTEIAQIVAQFSLDQLRYQYPQEICPADVSPSSYLQQLTIKGASEHYPEGVPEKVKAQIKRELQLIEELDYAKYFLTVYDIVVFARSCGILCQGRGAAANSAVCYALGITAVNPNEINLLFERFISKERNEPPDIDIDFEHERREEVIQYIYSKYGRHRAALAAAVITYRTRSAVRDVGKVLGLSAATINCIIKHFQRSTGELLDRSTLAARGLDPRCQATRLTISLVQSLRGFPRHLTQHVGGFVISEQPLSEIVPIENAAMAQRTVIEWDKDDLDALGMLKIDILALGMLTMIRKAFNLINKEMPQQGFCGTELMLHSIPVGDKQVYDMICRADTVGVFQIESRAQMSMLPRLRPRCFYDLVIEVAIVRPGPIQGGMVHPYLRRRMGKESVDYPSPAVRKILEPTLGVPIFQEQVMELAVVAAGFTPGEADQLRRAIASWRRDKQMLSKFSTRLIGGMLSNGYSKEFAQRVFEQIQGFGEYGFPQSHAASFALLVYVSAWLKCHYPAAFAAALLNSQPMGFYLPAQIVGDAEAHGVEVRAVDVNFSSWDCSLETTSGTELSTDQMRKPALRLGLRLVKGLRREQAERIVATVSSAGHRVRSLRELWRASGVAVYSLQRLARADAFTSLGLGRSEALWQLKRFSDQRLPLLERIPESDLPLDQQGSSELPALEPATSVARDYQTTGLSLKAHPLSFIRAELLNRLEEFLLLKYLRQNRDFKQSALLPNGRYAAACGMVLVRQRPATASGVVFMTIEDETAMLNLIIRPKIFERLREAICDSAFVLTAGKVQREGEVVHLIVDQVQDISTLFNLSASIAGEPQRLHPQQFSQAFSRDFH